MRFIEGFFELNPIKRITVSEALNHDFLTKQPTPTFFYMKYKIEKNCYIYNIRQRKMENLEKKEKEKNKEYNPWDQAMNKILNIYDPDKNIDCFLESIIGKKKSLDIENKKLVKKIKKE